MLVFYGVRARGSFAQGPEGLPIVKLEQSKDWDWIRVVR